VMEYLVKQGEFEVVDRIYREVCEEATGREEASIGSDTES
jgi:hypothetical protein